MGLTTAALLGYRDSIGDLCQRTVVCRTRSVCVLPVMESTVQLAFVSALYC